MTPELGVVLEAGSCEMAGVGSGAAAEGSANAILMGRLMASSKATGVAFTLDIHQKEESAA